MDIKAGRPARVLCIEDNVTNIALIQQIFRKIPLSCSVDLTIVETGLSGLATMETLRPDIVLLDLHLPDISGQEILGRLRNQPDSKPPCIIVITADAAPGTVAEARFLGADAVLTKPLDLAAFASQIELALTKLKEDRASDR